MPKKKTTGAERESSKAAPKGRSKESKAPVLSARNTIYQLKIILADIDPPIWRRLLTKDCSLAKLHHLIQVSMGWDDAHLHQFEFGENYFGNLRQWEGGWDEPEIGDERKVKLSEIVAQRVKKFVYEYDMGDSWRHTITVEKVLPAEAGAPYPRCIEGARACPFEDCGGTWGYVTFLEAIRDPKHEQHGEMLEWIGGEFDPEAFDLQAVNKQLAELR